MGANLARADELVTLPRALERWRHELRILPEDLAVTLGKLMLTLAPAMDSFSRRDSREEGEIDGFDGIDRRGSYERLLGSEWLLREQFPLEFLRRAASAEHSFFRLAQREPAPRRAPFLLFDTGPDQLGACRLAQLAILMLASERASQQKYDLTWQALHEATLPPLRTVDEQSVRRFLHARSPFRLEPSAIDAWLARKPGYEFWLIGVSDRIAAEHPNLPRIAIREPVSVNSDSLDVEFHVPGRPTRGLTLELPPIPDAVRLLRNPFEVRRMAIGADSVPVLGSNLLLNCEGNRLWYRDLEGQLCAHTVGSKRSNWRERAPSGVRFIAVTSVYKQTLWITHQDDELVLGTHRAGPALGGSLSARCSEPLSDEESRISELFWFRKQQVAVFIAPDRSLWRADFRAQRAERIGSGVVASVGWLEFPLVLLERWSEGAHSAGPGVIEITADGVRALQSVDEPMIGASFLRGVEQRLGKWLLGRALGDGSYRFELWSHRRSKPGEPVIEGRLLRERTLQCPSGATVVAIDADAHLDQPGLVALDASGHELLLVRGKNSASFLKTDSPITAFVASPNGPFFAFATERGEIGVLKRNGEMRARWGSAR